MKKIIYILLIITIFSGCSLKSKENKKEVDENIKILTSEAIIKNQRVENIEISNISLIYENKESIFKCDFTNKSNKVDKINDIRIHLKNKIGEDIAVLSGYIGGEINPNETLTITSSSSFDLTNAYSVSYEIIR